MADLNGAGAATIGGLSATAQGHVEWWSVALVHPAAGAIQPSTAPVLRVVADSWDGQPKDVQFQVATEPTFASPLWDQTLTNSPASGTTATDAQATGLTDGGDYFWRARAGLNDQWGPWSEVWALGVNLQAGYAIDYSYLNVGVEITPDSDAAEYVYENVGVEHTPYFGSIEYGYENVGVEITIKSDAVEYAYEGDVDTSTPTPMIWFLKPASGRSGDGIRVYGWGFGDLQSTYNGLVQLQYPDPVGWVAVSVTSWQTYPADSEAYGPDRVLNEVTAEIDMQHTVIEIVIPADTLPPGYPLRVRTDGP